MRLKHNKKRNTAFVYEALVRELTTSVVKNDKNKQTKVFAIMKEHFHRGTELHRELDLYRSLYETKEVEKHLAEKIMTEVKEKYSSLDKRMLFREQTALINKINKTLSKKIFTNFVPKFKSLASIYSIFQDACPVKDRVLLEENIINQMSESCPQQNTEADKKPVDTIVYNTFVKKFNQEYSETLSESQKELLNRYISSFSDNGIELKFYLNEEIGSLKKALVDSKDNPLIGDDPRLGEKVEKVYSLLESYKDKEIDTDLIEVVLKTQDFIEELSKKDDTIS
jgi:hypothetical protein